MPIYELTYRFERGGGNIQYRTEKRIENAADGLEECSLLATGLSLAAESTNGIGYVDVEDRVPVPEVFTGAANIQPVQTVGSLPVGEESVSAATGFAPEEAAKNPPRGDEDTTQLSVIVDSLNETTGSGFILDSELRPIDPFAGDVWVARLSGEGLEIDTPISTAAIQEFQSRYESILEERAGAKIGVYRAVDTETIQLFVAGMFTENQLYSIGTFYTGWSRFKNLHRLELSKVALAVATDSHAPGELDAIFRSDSGATVTSRQLGFIAWLGDSSVSYHPLGVIVDGELYRPATAGGSRTGPGMGSPLVVTSHRDSPSTPWQYGVTRSDGDLLLTMARAGPEKFDPVIKRFETEPYLLDEPLIVPHTITRRVWQEDPENPHVKSSRTEGQRCRLVYRDSEGWHVACPDPSDGFPDAGSDRSFEQTRVPGVEVHSTGIRADESGDLKSTIEREYRITEEILDAYRDVYVLVYGESEEESVERLHWDITDAIAHKLRSEEEQEIIDSVVETRDEEFADHHSALALTQAKLIGDI